MLRKFPTGVRGLGLGGGVRYQSDLYAGFALEYVTPGIAFGDLALSYDFGASMPELDGVSLQLNATNVTDERVVGCVDVASCFYDEGAKFSASVSAVR